MELRDSEPHKNKVFLVQSFQSLPNPRNAMVQMSCRIGFPLHAPHWTLS